MALAMAMDGSLDTNRISAKITTSGGRIERFGPPASAGATSTEVACEFRFKRQRVCLKALRRTTRNRRSAPLKSLSDARLRQGGFFGPLYPMRPLRCLHNRRRLPTVHRLRSPRAWFMIRVVAGSTPVTCLQRGCHESRYFALEITLAGIQRLLVGTGPTDQGAIRVVAGSTPVTCLQRGCHESRYFALEITLAGIQRLLVGTGPTDQGAIFAVAGGYAIRYKN
jgi:hypothetical protein